MTYNFDGYNYLVRLEKGEKLAECLDKFMSETKIEGGWLNGVGAADEITIGLYQPKTKDYKWKTFNEQMEITALVGNLAYGADGKMMFHLHGTFGDKNFQTVSGHVKDFLVTATLELFVHRAYQPTRRKFDDETGLQLLDLGNNG